LLAHQKTAFNNIRFAALYREEKAVCYENGTARRNTWWGQVAAPLAKLLCDGWEQINLRRAEYEIRKKIEGTNLVWNGWYAFRRGLATNLYR